MSVADVMAAGVPSVRDDLGLNYWDERARIARMTDVIGAQRVANSKLAAVIAPTLVALDWFGAPRRLAALLPESDRPIVLQDMRFLLSALGFRTELSRPRGGRIDTASLPVGSLAVTGSGDCWLYLGRTDGSDHWWHDGEIGGGPQATGGLHVLKILRDLEHQPLGAPQTSWMSALIDRFGVQLGQLAFVSLFINLLALAVSLYVMSVYQLVIPSGTTVTLGTLFLVAALAVLGAWLLRLGRASAIAGISEWVGVHVSTLALLKLLGLQYETVARSGTLANAGRIRSAEGIRQMFGGQSGLNVVDYPFVFIFLAAIAIMGGWLVLVPMASLILYLLISIPVARYLGARSEHVGRTNLRLNEETAALVRRVRELGSIGGRETWLRRYAEAVQQNALANRDNAIALALSQTIARTLAPLTVLATLVVGVSLVLSGAMNAAGLIASMMLIWRVTTPAQQAFSFLLRLSQLRSDFRQVDALMRSDGEGSAAQITSPVVPVRPSISLERVYYRFSVDQEPALNSVSFAVEAGSRVAIVGPNGAGKSTLLACIAGLRTPQNGRILIDGRDIRQFEAGDYRAWIGYLAQDLRGLHLSVRNYLTLAHPGLGDDALEATIERVGGNDWREVLADASRGPVSLSTMIEPWRDDLAARRARLLIALAEATIVDPPILLLDHPEVDNDPKIAARLMAFLDSLRGRSTVFIATHDPEIIKTTDLLVVLDQGNIVHAGPTAQDPNPSAGA